MRKGVEAESCSCTGQLISKGYLHGRMPSGMNGERRLYAEMLRLCDKCIFLRRVVKFLAAYAERLGIPEKQGPYVDILYWDPIVSVSAVRAVVSVVIDFSGRPETL